MADQLTMQKIFTENLKKELAHFQINRHFQLLPKSLPLHTEKPTKRPVTARDSVDKEYLKSIEITVHNSITAVPPSKAAFPQTAAQEIGWLTFLACSSDGGREMQNDDEELTTRWNYPRTQCDIVRFAEAARRSEVNRKS